jgi:outer membrane lipoprotein
MRQQPPLKDHASAAGGLGLVVALCGAAVTLAVEGCASQVPAVIRGDAPGTAFAPVSIEEVQRDPASHIGERVRWGGGILSVRNLPDTTEIEVLARPLASDGEPRADADPEGRFIARVPGFIDPATYPKERLLTVAGAILEVTTRDIGSYPYRYPVIAASSRYLWPAAAAPERSPWYYGYYGYGPWYRWPYGPFYDPWYWPGYGPW